MGVGTGVDVGGMTTVGSGLVAEGVSPEGVIPGRVGRAVQAARMKARRKPGRASLLFIGLVL
jgi:hypothetical protein